MTTRFVTAEDAKNEILSMPDVTPDAFDIDAIFAEAYTYTVDTDDDGNELLNTAGFYCTVDADEFWAIVESHATA